MPNNRLSIAARDVMFPNMASSGFIISAFVLSAATVQIVPLEGDRFEVSTVYQADSVRAAESAILALMQAAKKVCKGKGRAVSEGSLLLSAAEPGSTGRERLKLSEVYSCRPPVK